MFKCMDRHAYLAGLKVQVSFPIKKDTIFNQFGVSWQYVFRALRPETAQKRASSKLQNFKLQTRHSRCCWHFDKWNCVNDVSKNPTQESLGAAARMLQSLASHQVRASKIILTPNRGQQNHSQIHRNPKLGLYHRYLNHHRHFCFAIAFVLPIIVHITFIT